MPVELGLSVTPNAEGIDTALAAVRRADELGFDLVGIQDHPYQRRFVDTLSLLAIVLARTERIHAFPNVANLPLRPPALLAKQAATLDLLSGGRFELGLGAGAFWEGIEAMGGPKRTPGESLAALEEAVELVRLFWSGEPAITYEGRFYHVRGLHPGPPPAHPIGVWIGGYGPRMLRLIGRLADGWIPSLGYAPPARIPELRARLDDAAAAAGRDPRAIKRIYNVGGRIGGRAERGLGGDAGELIEQLRSFVEELGFDAIVFWPEGDPVEQVERFAAEVAPALRDLSR
jgi:alkanesulfonate monooxygenase SsuD/methylene tetrahydromethanopterin reductase-like flavin-dependent oxidoreductase (luciferase family)